MKRLFGFAFPLLLLALACTPQTVFLLEKKSDVQLAAIPDGPAGFIINIAAHPRELRISGIQPIIYKISDEDYLAAIRDGLSTSKMGSWESLWTSSYDPASATLGQQMQSGQRSRYSIHLLRSELALEEELTNFGRLSTTLMAEFFVEIYEGEEKALSLRLLSQYQIAPDATLDQEIADCLRLALNNLAKKGTL